MKDGAVKQGLEWFEKKVGELREAKKKKEDFIVALWDAAYANDSSDKKDLSYEEFKEKYLQMMELSN